jgi:hypothetical protein
MQADVEGAFGTDKLKVAGTFGRREISKPHSFTDELISRRHYIQYTPLDKLSFRAGRFQHAYGINTPDHVIATKRGLGWDTGSETYNLEAAWLGEQTDAFATLVFGRPDAPELQREGGISMRSTVFLDNRFKIGGSYFYGKNDQGYRHVFGPLAILGFSPRLFLLFELDFQGTNQTSGNFQWGIVDYLRFDYELTQGLHTYLVQELLKGDFSNPSGLTDSYGVGMRFFPRPHFEFQIQWQKQRIRALSDTFGDFVWLMAHYYL